MSSELVVIYWRDIPAQVTATAGGRTARVALSDRFQQAIDAAAMEAGLVDSAAYLEGWRQESRICGEDIERETAAEADRLEGAFTPDRLQALVCSGGIGASEPLP